MNMGMNFELLAPGMQHTEETDLCPKVSRVACDFEKGFRTDTKEEIVEDLLVLQDQWRQVTGQGEHDMGRRASVEVLADERRSTVPELRSDTSGNGGHGSCCTRWGHDVRSGCTHRDGRRVRRYGSAQWPAAL